MKKPDRVLAYSIILFSSLLIGCKKQVAEPLHNRTEIRLQTPGITACKPVLFGIFSQYNNTWHTVAQKWYENGRVRYFKGKLSGSSLGHAGLIGMEPLFDIEWGEVTYEGNQVYLRDVAKNRVVLRVTLDEMGKPAASYFYNITDDLNGGLIYDTTYYYYNGSRLDYIIRSAEISVIEPYVFTDWDKFTFEYDAEGNIKQIDNMFAHTRMRFEYNYSKPVTGIVANYFVTTSFRLLEFLELLKIPMQHALSKTTFGPSHDAGIPTTYSNYVIENGNVHSYEGEQGFKYNYYTGWDCGNPVTTQAFGREMDAVNSLTQFRRQYQASPK
ncbi:MAG TPA: hypothetical protein VD996_14070 [Chitinophagaceae bacterium]|nr:hypothetical protein [Chitinophagaceae bacterium]